MKDKTSVLVSARDGIMTITLNRPAAANAINLDVAKELMEASIWADQDNSIRCVVLTGSDKYFCVGGDVVAFAKTVDELPGLLAQLTSYIHPAVSRLLRMNKPLVVSVNGPAAGAGLSLAMLGDLVFAARSAHFTPAYSAVGLSPDLGATWLIPRLMGLRRAQEFIVNNRRLSADEACSFGLVTEVVDDENLKDVTAEAASRLAKSAVGALGKTRNLLLASLSSPLETHLENEARAIAESARLDGREGVAAFVQKRKPDFSRVQPDE